MHGPYLKPAISTPRVLLVQSASSLAVTAVTIDNIYAVTNKVLELEPSPLQLLTLRFISSPALPCTRTFKIFMRI